MKDMSLEIDGREVLVTNPAKLMWPALGITKLQYVTYLIAVAPHLLAYTRDRMLMIWRYPEGIRGKRLEERSIHGQAPAWIPRVIYKEKERILLNDASTLAWVANLAAVELHVPFDKHYRKDYPTELVFDLDPPDGSSFELVIEVALQLKSVLDSLHLPSVPKTSGATGLQIYVPLKPNYTFEQTRSVNRFIAEYLQQRLPDRITLDRVVERRGNKLYFDYLQLWRGRTMPAPYSLRAKDAATVSTPLSWNEVEMGRVRPSDFTLFTIHDRLKHKGDLFSAITIHRDRHEAALDDIIHFVKAGR